MSMDKYEVLEHIGDGAFDSGLLMRHEVGKKYLLKKIQLEPQTDRSHRSSLKEAGGDGGGVLNRRKVPALSAASSVRSLCRVPAQHLVSILAVFADVLAGNKATPVATAQLVTIMQPEGISPTVGSNGSLSHATDSLIVRMIVLNRQNMSAAMEVFILPRHHDHQRACYPDDPDVEELPAMAAFEEWR
nr:uncharacterized protein LOC127314161 isoform X13 [Lolium perenne]